jgi:glycosyltransferase involved in cell wall biosynthesis
MQAENPDTGIETRTDRHGAPTISVIVPVYNGARTIESCLESLLRQDYPADRYEIIVVDNGSSDDTAAIVSRYPVRLLTCAERGPSPARNAGIAHSRAQVVAFTDADCVVDPAWLVELASGYADPAVGGVGGPILAYDLAQRSAVELFCDEQSPLVNYGGGEGEFLPYLFTANASYRRPLVESVGGFNALLVTAEDVDLAWRVQCETGARLAYAPEATVYHHHRATVKDLMCQYRQYGFGEIVLDTLYGHHAGYPRGLGSQARRMARQVGVLPRYMLSILWRHMQGLGGRISPYEAMLPTLVLAREVSSIYGKLEGLLATRLMTDAATMLGTQADQLLARFYAPRGR